MRKLGTVTLDNCIVKRELYFVVNCGLLWRCRSAPRPRPRDVGARTRGPPTGRTGHGAGVYIKHV